MNLTQRLAQANQEKINASENAAVCKFQAQATAIYGETRYVSHLVQTFTYWLRKGEPVNDMHVQIFERKYNVK